MSLVVHAYKINKENFWSFVKILREFYLNSSKYKIYRNEPLLLASDNYVVLQLFEREGNTFIFRILGETYYFYNEWSNFSDVSSVFYDDRGEGPGDNLEVAEWIVGKISVGEFFLVPIITKDILIKNPL